MSYNIPPLDTSPPPASVEVGTESEIKQLIVEVKATIRDLSDLRMEVDTLVENLRQINGGDPKNLK